MKKKKIFIIPIILFCLLIFSGISNGQLVYPEINSVYTGEKFENKIKFKVPDEYYGRHVKGVFYFTDKKSGERYYLSRKYYPIWFDELERIDYVSFNTQTKILDVFGSNGCYYDENGNTLFCAAAYKYLPVGEYLINADIYNISNVLIRNYVGGPFKIVEPSVATRSTGVQSGTSQLRENPLIVEDFFIESEDIHSNGVNLKLGIRGRTRDGSPVARYCSGGVCGGEIKFSVIIIDPGPDYGKTYVENYNEIKQNRLKSNPNAPSTFGTFNDPLRITINYPSGKSYRIVMKLKLNFADEKTLTHEILQARGSTGAGSGEVRGGTSAIYLISPKENDIFIEGNSVELKWGKQGVIKTRILYSTDKGTTWKKIVETSDSNYTWLVPKEYTEWGKMKFQWYNYPPEEGGNLFKEEIVNMKIRGIELISPKSGEVLKPGSSYAIKWNGGTKGDLKVKLLWGAPADTVITCTSNDGIQHWVIPGSFPRHEIEIKAILLEDCSQSKSFGESIVRNVIISNPWISFLSPKYLENVKTDSLITISYIPKIPQGYSTNGKVKLYYKFLGEPNWIEIANNLPTTYNMQWKIPSVMQDKTLEIRAVWEHPVGDMVEYITGETKIIIKKTSGQFMREKK